MQDRNKKLGLGIAALVVVLGLVAVLVNTQKMSEPSDELMGSADDELTVEEIGPPPSLVIDPDVDLSGALTADGNFYQFERNQALPDEDDLDESTSRETWTPLVFDREYDSIVEFLEENTDVTNQLTLAVVWDEEDQDWNVYPNEIFRSDYNIDTLNIFSEDFDGTLIFNTSRAYRYADHTEERVGDFDVERGWNYGPKPDFDELDGKAVVFWTGDVTGNAVRLTPSGDLNDAIDEDFFDDLDDDEVYWFYVKGTVADACSDVEAYVCGVDGNTYLNSCVADEEDVTVDYEGQCKNDRTALRGRLEDDTLELDDTLVLEFFTSNSDNSSEDIDVDLDEIDLDDNDSGLAIYEIDGARFNFVTAFEDSDIDVNDDSIEIDLDNNLVAGEYQLRIFDTFEREKFEELELEFTVVEPDEIEEVLYDLQGHEFGLITLEPDMFVEAIDADEALDNFKLYRDGVEVPASEYRITFDEANNEVEIETIGVVLEQNNYEVRVTEEINEEEGWIILETVIVVTEVSDDDDNEVISLSYTYDEINIEYTLSGNATGRRNALVLTPSVDPLDMSEVDLSEIEDAFDITSNYEGGEAVDVDQCTISMGSDKKVRIECPKTFGGQLVVEWAEVINQADGYRLEAGSLSDFSEAG